MFTLRSNLIRWIMYYGKLLVDPVKMTIDAWGDAGGLIALALAWYIEERFVNFSVNGLESQMGDLCVLGFLTLWWFIGHLQSMMIEIFGSHLVKFAYQFAFFLRDDFMADSSEYICCKKACQSDTILAVKFIFP